jgi:hypothetical protein
VGSKHYDAPHYVVFSVPLLQIVTHLLKTLLGGGSVKTFQRVQRNITVEVFSLCPPLDRCHATRMMASHNSGK